MLPGNSHERYTLNVAEAPEGSTLTVATRFMDFTVQQKTSADGKPETWATIETRPAFEIAASARVKAAAGPECRFQR